jgi:hypothetical protein
VCARATAIATSIASVPLCEHADHAMPGWRATSASASKTSTGDGNE